MFLLLFALLSFAMICSALLCCALLCFALLCFALLFGGTAGFGIFCWGNPRTATGGTLGSGLWPLAFKTLYKNPLGKPS